MPNSPTLGFSDDEITLMADVAMEHAIRVYSGVAMPVAVVREMLAAVAKQRELVGA